MGTDMYDGYAHLARRRLPNARVLADRFRIVKQLTEAVDRIGARRCPGTAKTPWPATS